MKDEILMAISIITESDSPCIEQGEVGYGIYPTLIKKYLQAYGENGKEELLKNIEYLRKEVEARWEEISEGDKR
ncbi:MAG: hypothetical protein DDT22_01183 [candidate division WS2 bacterium]|nr:hypothetical protein [Candidatus Lithacetigena glycinireducens]